MQQDRLRPPRYKPFWMKAMENLSQERSRLYKIAKQNGTILAWAAWRQIHRAIKRHVSMLKTSVLSAGGGKNKSTRIASSSCLDGETRIVYIDNHYTYGLLQDPQRPHLRGAPHGTPSAGRSCLVWALQPVISQNPPDEVGKRHTMRLAICQRVSSSSLLH
jgi:hypothetical protein